MDRVEGMDRRGFIKKAAVGTAVAAAAAGTGLLTGCNSTQPTAAPVPEGKVWDAETDVVIAGGGLAGLNAAAAAIEKGVKVILVEAAPFTFGRRRPLTN